MDETQNSNSAPLIQRTTFGIPQPAGWPLERVLHLLAGTVVLTSLALSRFGRARWRILTAFVGANLVFDATVGWCPAKLLLHSLGFSTILEGALRNSPDRI